MKWGPTSANCSPARIVFVRSAEGKRSCPALSSGNTEKTLTAPVTAIVAWDTEFYERLPELFPHGDAKSWFTTSPAHAEETAFRNSSMQAAYLIFACRARGWTPARCPVLTGKSRRGLFHRHAAEKQSADQYRLWRCGQTLRPSAARPLKTPAGWRKEPS